MALEVGGDLLGALSGGHVQRGDRRLIELAGTRESVALLELREQR